VNIQRLENGEGLDLPLQQTPGSAGFDLQAADSCVLFPGCQSLIGTGFAWEIPAGFVGFITPRSGLAKNHFVTVTNSPGTVDSDYRGEIKVLLHNKGAEPYRFNRGERIAQMVIVPVATFTEIIEVDSLSDTVRGLGGFGHTGT